MRELRHVQYRGQKNVSGKQLSARASEMNVFQHAKHQGHHLIQRCEAFFAFIQGPY